MGPKSFQPNQRCFRLCNWNISSRHDTFKSKCDVYVVLNYRLRRLILLTTHQKKLVDILAKKSFKLRIEGAPFYLLQDLKKSIIAFLGNFIIGYNQFSEIPH